MRDKRQGEIFKGLTAGLVGGLVASWTMNQFQAIWTKIAKEFEQCHQQITAEGNNEREEQETSVSARQSVQIKNDGQAEGEEQNDTTVKAASAISEGLFSHKLTKSEKAIAGPAVHYAFGAAVGGLYGAVAEVRPNISAGAGLPFGAVFWLVADETAVPLLGLSKAPTEYPLSTHVYGLTSHFVFGVTAEVVRRAIRTAL